MKCAVLNRSGPHHGRMSSALDMHTSLLGLRDSCVGMLLNCRTGCQISGFTYSMAMQASPFRSHSCTASTTDN